MYLSKVFLFLTLTILLSVFGAFDRIQKALEKAEYDKAKELILRGYLKEPENPGFSYYHAVLLFIDNYDGFNPDSARIVLKNSFKKYQESSDDLKEKLAEESITEENFRELTLNIRDFFFQETLTSLSIPMVNDFLTKYPKSADQDLLIFKRDSMIFKEVRAENSKTGYRNFIENYSSSAFKSKADSLLDVLRFQDLKENGNYQDHISFRSQYPNSSYIKEVEEYIMKISTSSHSIQSLIKFIETSKVDKWKKRAADVLYYLNDQEINDIHLLPDSIRFVKALSERSLFPIIDRGLFGFQNIDGTLQIAPNYDDIQQTSKCELVEDDWIFVKKEDEGKIIMKDERVVIESAEDYRSISMSIGLVKIHGDWFLFHKSGYKIIESPVLSAAVFSNGWIKVNQNGKWGLYTLFGNPIAESKYDDIYKMEEFWVFEKDRLMAVYTMSEILNEVEDRGLSLEFKFEDLELVDKNKLIGFRGDRECLLNHELKFLIPWGNYEIYPDPAGWYLRSWEGYYLYNNTDERIIDRKYRYLASNGGWLSLQTEKDWILIPRIGKLLPERNYDSIKLINKHAALVFKDKEKELLFTNGNRISLKEHIVQSFPSQSDFLLISNDGALGLYNQYGESVMDGRFEEVSFINDSLLIVSKNQKQGIIKIDGSYLLNPIFSTLSKEGDLISTLYKGKIGCYDLSINRLISANYEARISKINDYYVIKNEGKYGLINANEEEIITQNYDEITYWNDSSFLVTQNDFQFFINISEEKLIDPIADLKLLFENENEKLYKFTQNGSFGLLSNENGILLKPEYSDIVNIGDKETPLFFADQHLSNAGYHVVSYLNSLGENIFSEAYRITEFDRIICDD